MRPRSPLLLALSLWALLTSGLAAAQTPEAAAGPSPQEVEAVIQTLEDPARRDALVKQLRVLAGAGAAERPESEVKSATAQLMQALSGRLESASAQVGKLAGVIQGVPAALTAAREALADPDQRDRWLSIVGSLATVLGAAFVAALLVALIPVRARRVAERSAPRSWLARLALLLGLAILDLLPIAALAGTAYAVMAAIDLQAQTRLVALALVNASVAARSVALLANLVLAPATPHLRLFPLGDESAHYLRVWLRRLAVVAAYGFFGLQAALLLGLPATVYHVLLKLVGLVVLGMLLVFVAQNRRDIAVLIKGPETPEPGQWGALRTARAGLARVWHVVAILYLLVLYAVWALEVAGGFVYVAKASILTAVVLAAAAAATRLLGRVADYTLALNDDLRARYPGLEQRLNRYFPALFRIARAAIYALALLLVAQAWGLAVLAWLASDPGRVLVGALAKIAFILLATLAIWELASWAIQRKLAEADAGRAPSARIKTLLTVARNALLVVLSVVSALMVLSELGVNIAPLLAGAGVVGLAVGFGAQRLVQDIITGVFILFQDLMSVGDVVKLGDKAGLVEALSIRTVRLRDLSGTVHTIPFSAIDTVSNLTKDFSFHVFDIGVAYREDVDQVMEVLRQVGDELREDPEIGPLILEPLEIFGLDAFGDSAIVIKGRIKTRPIKQWAVGRAFNRRVKMRFDELDIEIPFPHRTLYFGVDKDGMAPPGRIELEGRQGAARADAVPAETPAGG